MMNLDTFCLKSLYATYRQLDLYVGNGTASLEELRAYEALDWLFEENESEQA